MKSANAAAKDCSYDSSPVYAPLTAQRPDLSAASRFCSVCGECVGH